MLSKQGTVGEAGSETAVAKLHLHCQNGDLHLVQTALIRTPELLNSRNGVGQTPLAVAVKQGHIELVQELIRLGADPNLSNNVVPLFGVVGWTNPLASCLLEQP